MLSLVGFYLLKNGITLAIKSSWEGSRQSSLLQKFHTNYLTLSDLHLLTGFGQTVSIGRPSPIGRQNDFHLIQLVTGRAWDPQLARSLGEFDLNPLSTSLITAIHPFFIFHHLPLHLFRAKP
jgi:hypothetical protein